MIWNKVLVNKIKAIAALVLVFLLVLATNVMDNHHFDVVKQSLKTVYEDRLVVKDYIFKMSEQLKHKQMALLTEETERIKRLNAAANDSLQLLVDRYSNTKLTTDEAGQFQSLKDNLKELYKSEAHWLDQDSLKKKEAFLLYEQLDNNLHALFEIQLREGKRQIDTSNRAVAKSDLISRIEIGILITLGLIIQIIILYKPSK